MTYKPCKLEKVDTLVVRILTSIYVRYPRGIMLHASHYESDPSQVECKPGRFEALRFEELRLFCNTVRWLSESGFITYEREALGGSFYNVMMSRQGLGAFSVMRQRLHRQSRRS
ncbi:hypothetical protein DIE19_31375 [Burkholderia sp. Bp9126]|nr:hypothetical protein DIE19_31375 [Burkholderia sp. Bp9126]